MHHKKVKHLSDNKFWLICINTYCLKQVNLIYKFTAENKSTTSAEISELIMKSYIKLVLSVILILFIVVNCNEKKEDESNPTNPTTSDNPFPNIKVVKRITGLNGGEAVEAINSALYVGDLTGLSIYRISDPENPEFRKKIALTTVYDLYANRYDNSTLNLFAGCGGNGLTIFEIHGNAYLDPITKSFIAGGFYSDIDSEGSRIYVASQLSRGVRVFNIANAYQPTMEFSVDQQANSTGVAITSQGDLIVADYDGKVKFYDTILLPTIPATSPSISITAKLLSVSTWTDKACVGAESGVYFVQPVSSRQGFPAVKSSLLIGGDVRDSKILYKQSTNKFYAFLAAGNKDLVIVDVTDVANPKIVKELALEGNARSIVLYSNYAYIVGDNDINVIKYE